MITATSDRLNVALHLARDYDRWKLWQRAMRILSAPEVEKREPAPTGGDD